MNNHWETNYKAYQDGKIPFLYALWPHSDRYDPVKSQQISRAVHQPLFAVETDSNIPNLQSTIEVKGDGILVTSLKPGTDGNGYMLRLFNTCDKETTAFVKCKSQGCTLYLSDPIETMIKKIDGVIKMVPEEIVTLRITE